MQFNHGWTRMDADAATAKYTNRTNAFNAKTQRGEGAKIFPRRAEVNVGGKR
jgi:hypothetical protein